LTLDPDTLTNALAIPISANVVWEKVVAPKNMVDYYQSLVFEVSSGAF